MEGMLGDMMFDKTPLRKGDFVRIIGKDVYKGYVGIVKNKQSRGDEKWYSIELQANGITIKRQEENLEKHYQ